MSQIIVNCKQSTSDPRCVDVSFVPPPTHWGCVDAEALYSELEIECNKALNCIMTDVSLNQLNASLQSIINQWQATNSLWVKELY